MAFRLCASRTLNARLPSLALSRGPVRPFHATAVPLPALRITSSSRPLIIRPYASPSPLFRRHLFGLRKQTTDGITQAGRSAWKITARFVLYSGAFIVIAIAGFFIYDVCSLLAPRL